MGRFAYASVWSRYIALFAAAVGAAVLVVGWGAGIDFFRRIQPDFAAMVPSTAICFLLLSAAIVRLTYDGGRSFSIVCAVSAGCIAVAELLFLVGTGGSGLDPMLFTFLPPGDAMAFATSAGVILAAHGILGLTWTEGITRRTYPWTATLGLLLALVALVGYIFDSRALYEVFVFTAMALHTALLFALLFVAILLANPGRTWFAILIGSEPGSTGARRLLPLVALMPVAFSFITLKLTNAGYFDANFRLSLLAIAMTALASWAVLRNGYLQNQSSRERAQLFGELESSNVERALLLKELYHRVKNNLQQITAMLRIEARKLNDPQLSASFGSISDRIAALSTVHQLLISAPNPSEVEISEFLTNLCRGLAESHGLESRGITLEVKADPGRAHIEVAVSMGLLVNELITNAIKHAFGDGPGKIMVDYQERPEGLVLTVSDDGAGPPDDGAKLDSSGTGSLIIRSMVSQLKADLQISSANGMIAKVVMPSDINEQDRYE